MSVYKSMYRMVFAFIVFPFLLFSLLITNIYSSKLENVMADSLQVVAEAQIAEMTNFCEQQKEYLNMTGAMDISRMAMRGELDSDTMQYLDNMLYSQVRTQSSYMKTLALVDKNYSIVACSEEHDRYADDGIKSLIDCMGEQSFYISDVLTDEHGKRMLVTIAKIGDDTELLGYSLAEISLDFYGNIRERAKLWNESSFYLLDGREQIISAGTPEENRDVFVTTPGERSDYQKKFNAIDFEENPEGSFQYKIGNRDYITYYSDVEYTDWRVMLSTCLEGYLAQKAMYFLLAVFVVFLCIVLSVWLGRFASVRILQPIKSISDTLKAIRQNQDYSLRIDLKRKDELGTLSTEINELVDFIETEDMYKKRQQRLLKEKAEQDALTKVLNKVRISQYLQETIERCLGEDITIAILFVDIDDFKFFNTTYGHNVGDQVLLFLTSVLTQKTGGTVGRVGGDEFMVVIENPEYVRMLEACLIEIEGMAGSQFMVHGTGEQLPVYCSIGAVRVHFSGDGAKITAKEQPENERLTQERLTELADAAMYQAKNHGKRGHVILDYEQ